MPEDNDRYCREATVEDVRILKRKMLLQILNLRLLMLDSLNPILKKTNFLR